MNSKRFECIEFKLILSFLAEIALKRNESVISVNRLLLGCQLKQFLVVKHNLIQDSGFADDEAYTVFMISNEKFKLTV